MEQVPFGPILLGLWLQLWNVLEDSGTYSNRHCGAREPSTDYFQVLKQSLKKKKKSFLFANVTIIYPAGRFKLHSQLVAVDLKRSHVKDVLTDAH